MLHEAEERLLKALLKHEVEKLNEHLPKEFKTLEELLSMRDPCVKTRDGGEIIFDRSELEMIASLLPEELRHQLRLPIVLLRRVDLGPGVFSVSGGRAEAYVALKLISRKGGVKLDEVKLPLYIYRPEAQVLRRKLRTSTVIGFAAEGLLDLEGQ
ncbi:MAG: DUF61 family protein [Candidatus Nezhaarchaeota archaeon]|nr:DUF61 family protein [Candidatus Nezhaarchaeota archaeon]